MPQRKRRTQVERSEQTRRQLIDAAIDLILEDGLSHATVVDICRRAEVTTGALQHHFGSKGMLVASVVTELFVPFTREIEPLARPASIPLEKRVRRLVERYWRIYGDPRYFAVLEVLNAVRYDPVIGETVRSFRAGQVVVLEDFLPREFPDVRLTPTQMRLSVHWVLDLMRGFALRRLFDTEPSLPHDLIERCCQMILADFAKAATGEASR